MVLRVVLDHQQLDVSTRSVMSSTMPGIEENSCCTPWILILVMALPSRLESRIRRRLLPTVWPKPRSNGSTWNSPKVSVKVSRLQMTRLGSSRPRQRIRIDYLPTQESARPAIDQRLNNSMINCGVTGSEISWVDGKRETRPSGGSVLIRSSHSGTGGHPSARLSAASLRECSRFLTWIWSPGRTR